MIKQFWYLLTGKSDDNALVLDHIPVNRCKPEAKSAPPKPSGTTLEEAKKRHSKPFKAHIMVARETPPSRDLIEMNELSANNAAKHTVTQMNRGNINGR